MSIKYCSECGNKVNTNQKFCGECGTSIRIEKSNPISNNDSGSAVVALLLGIASIVLGYYIPIGGIILAFGAGYYSSKGINSKEKSSAYIGGFLAAVGIFLSVVMWFNYSSLL